MGRGKGSLICMSVVSVVPMAASPQARGKRKGAIKGRKGYACPDFHEPGVSSAECMGQASKKGATGKSCRSLKDHRSFDATASGRGKGKGQRPKGKGRNCDGSSCAAKGKGKSRGLHSSKSKVGATFVDSGMCAICQEELTGPCARLDCFHAFHRSCALRCEPHIRNAGCPLCRMPATIWLHSLPARGGSSISPSASESDFELESNSVSASDPPAWESDYASESNSESDAHDRPAMVEREWS